MDQFSEEEIETFWYENIELTVELNNSKALKQAEYYYSHPLGKLRKIMILRRMKKIEDMHNLLNELESYFEKQDSHFRGYYLSEKGMLYYALGDYDRSVQYMKLALEAHRQSKITSAIADSLTKITVLYWINNDYHEVKDSLQKALELYSELLKTKKQNLQVYRGINILMSLAYRTLSGAYFNLKDRELALSFAKKRIELVRSLDLKISLADAMDHLAQRYYQYGMINEALNLCIKIEAIIEEGDEFTSARKNTYHTLGDIYRIKGNYSTSLEYYYKSIENCQDDDPFIYHLHSDVGYTKIFQNKIDEGLSLMNSVLNQQSQPENLQDNINDLNIYGTLFKLVRIHTLLNQIETAKKYLQEFERYQESGTLVGLFDIRHKLMKALILKSSKRFMDKAKAQEILKEIVNEESNVTSSIDIESHLDALKHLIELLVLEYKISNEPEVMNELIEYTDQLYNDAVKHGIQGTIIEVLIHKSKLAIIENNFDESQSLLKQALEYARENDLPNYIYRIRKEEKYLHDTFGAIKKSIQQSELFSETEREKILNYIQFSKSIISDIESE